MLKIKTAPHIFFLGLALLLSANVPLFAVNMQTDDFVYKELIELYDRGIIPSYQFGIRPISRNEIGRLTAEMYQNIKLLNAEDQPYCEALMSKFATNYQYELSRLFKQYEVLDGYWLKTHSLDLQYSYFNYSKYLSFKGAEYERTSFDEYRNGRKYVAGNNFDLKVIYWLNFNDLFTFDAEPLLEWGIPSEGSSEFDFSFHRFYGQFNIFGNSILVGKDALEWGQMNNGKLSLSNNPKPLGYVDHTPLFKLSNDSSFLLPSFLSNIGYINYVLFFSKLDENRRFDKNSKLLGAKITFKPNYFELGISEIVQFGGSDKTGYSFNELFSEISGDKAYDNKNNSSESITNRFLGIDYRVSLPFLKSSDLYGEFLFDDLSLNSFDETISYGTGVRVPFTGISKVLSLNLEYINTSKYLYTSDIYKSGFTFNRDLLGNNLGPDAYGFYLSVDYKFNYNFSASPKVAFEKRMFQITDFVEQAEFSIFEIQKFKEYRIPLTINTSYIVTPNALLYMDAGYGLIYKNFYMVDRDKFDNDFFFSVVLTLYSPEIRMK